jgi:hypothetical protein
MDSKWYVEVVVVTYLLNRKAMEIVLPIAYCRKRIVDSIRDHERSLQEFYIKKHERYANKIMSPII